MLYKDKRAPITVLERLVTGDTLISDSLDEDGIEAVTYFEKEKRIRIDAWFEWGGEIEDNLDMSVKDFCKQLRITAEDL